MIAATLPEPRDRPAVTALLRGATILAVSLLVAAAIVVLHEYALLLFGCLGVIALVGWRPRYGLYLTVLLALAFEPTKSDALMLPGYLTQSDIKSLTGLSFLPFTPLEALLTLTALTALAHAAVGDRKSVV